MTEVVDHNTNTPITTTTTTPTPSPNPNPSIYILHFKDGYRCGYFRACGIKLFNTNVDATTVDMGKSILESVYHRRSSYKEDEDEVKYHSHEHKYYANKFKCGYRRGYRRGYRLSYSQRNPTESRYDRPDKVCNESDFLSTRDNDEEDDENKLPEKMKSYLESYRIGYRKGRNNSTKVNNDPDYYKKMARSDDANFVKTFKLAFNRGAMYYDSSDSDDGRRCNCDEECNCRRKFYECEETGYSNYTEKRRNFISKKDEGEDYSDSDWAETHRPEGHKYLDCHYTDSGESDDEGDFYTIITEIVEAVENATNKLLSIKSEKYKHCFRESVDDLNVARKNFSNAVKRGIKWNLIDGMGIFLVDE